MMLRILSIIIVIGLPRPISVLIFGGSHSRDGARCVSSVPVGCVVWRCSSSCDVHGVAGCYAAATLGPTRCYVTVVCRCASH